MQRAMNWSTMRVLCQREEGNISIGGPLMARVLGEEVVHFSNAQRPGRRCGVGTSLLYSRTITTPTMSVMYFDDDGGDGHVSHHPSR